MTSYLIRRFIYLIPTVIIISLISFTIIVLPPGDFLTVYQSQLAVNDTMASNETIEKLRERYGLNQPLYVQYWKWISGFVQGDFGESFLFSGQEVKDLIWERLGLTVVISGCTLLFTWLVAIPIGIYSATHQYSFFDYIITFIGFLGLSIPNFFLALILMVILFSLGSPITGGLFSQHYIEAGWSWLKLIDLLKHIWIPVVVIGTAGTASLIRIMRGNLLDQLGQQYVITARAKGLKEAVVIYKHAVRIAINPLISHLGYQLPKIISGGTIVAIVLSLPTTGPIYLKSLLGQDMYLAGTFLMLLTTLLLIGNFMADILLAWADPRICYY